METLVMNERIRELAEQANELDYETFDEFNHKTVKHYKFNKEKFAELIVRECIAQCEQVATDADAKSKSKFVTDDGRMLHEGMWGGAKNCSGQIKQHFGVKE
jgi:hypothetical protein